MTPENEKKAFRKPTMGGFSAVPVKAVRHAGLKARDKNLASSG
jgi:hypothetical protein